jgi:hypothetical protein
VASDERGGFSTERAEDGGPPLPGFAEVFILKGDEVVCFDIDSQVFILEILIGKTHWGCHGATESAEFGKT